MLSYPSCLFYYDYFIMHIYISLTWYSLVICAQAIQEVFVAKEWVKDAQNDAQVEANLHAEVNKALGASEQKK